MTSTSDIHSAPPRVEYEGSRFATLTDQAYARWQALDCARSAWLLHLDVAERSAAVLAGYIAQVNNGGHQQWLDNGYHAADRVYLEFALDALAPYDGDCVERARRLIHEAGLREAAVLECGDDDGWDRACAALDALDDQFYEDELAERLLAAAEAHLVSAAPRGTSR